MMAGDNTKVTVSGEIAYSAQKPWIMSKTVRENITFMGE
jgi:ABC-type multidrug transport system fused ATPase/permease subunit